jgi:hypothetical protein
MQPGVMAAAGDPFATPSAFAPSSAPPLLRTHQLSLVYPGGTTALAGLTVDVPRGSAARTTGTTPNISSPEPGPG